MSRSRTTGKVVLCGFGDGGPCYVAPAVDPGVVAHGLPRHYLHPAPVKPIAAVLACLLCFSCASVPIGSGKRTVSSDFLGVAHAGYSRSAAEYELLRTLGARFARIDFSWDRIEPRKGLYDFSFFDAVVQAAAGNGIGILAILDYDVPWLHPDGKKRGYVSPERLGDWLEYVRRVAERYRRTVFAYEIWNEPNGSFWTGSAEEFADLTRETADAIRRADPAALIVVGSFYRDPMGFARTMIRRGAMAQADAVSFHPYAPNAISAAQTSARFMRALRSLGWEGDVWITEIGYSTRGIYPNTIPDSEVPSSLVKTLILLTAGGAERIVWYALTDKYMEAEEPRGESLLSIAEGYFGLSYPDYSPKRGAYAFAAAARIIQGSVYDPGLVSVEPGAQGVRAFPFLQSDGTLGLALWAARPIRVELSPALHGESLFIDRPGSVTCELRSLELSSVPVVLVVDEPAGGLGEALFTIRPASH